MAIIRVANIRFGFLNSNHFGFDNISISIALSRVYEYMDILIKL